MKKKEANYFRIGIFVIASLVLLAAGLVVFGVGQFFRTKVTIETYVDGTVQGIEVGSAVKLRGVTVGKVTDVSFVFTRYPAVEKSDLTNYVVLVMQIEREIFPEMFELDNLQPILAENIERGMRVQIEPAGITGLNYLEINFLEPQRFAPLKIAWKPDNYYLPSAPGELTNMLDSVNNIMREVEGFNIKGVSDGVVTLLDNLNRAVTGAQLKKLSDGAQALFSQIKSAVDEANIPNLSEQMKTLVGDLTQAVSDLDVPTLSGDTQALLEEVARSNAQLKSILANLEPASQINGDELSATLSNLRIISENLREASAAVVRDPSRVIWQRPAQPASVLDPPNRKRR
jgi:ABC-type transporter Mla subunit MlaD